MFKSVYFTTREKKKPFRKSLNLWISHPLAAKQLVKKYSVEKIKERKEKEMLDSTENFNFRNYSQSTALPRVFNISGKCPNNGTDELFLFSPA